ncbi:amidohydrolase family protein [uncultured Limosilactobacillus sp.]|uniref:amidohydrolase family protein n=1 Tax=uncultured Limosilactobacillus sp. TaxID=2837629 RepID=UPI0025DABBFE|nr:amidohydrolase family protein [uncultured Limosilactobacillus sp.]
MKKIDAHLHLVRSLAGLNGKGRLTPLGHGKAIWDDGEVIKLIPDGWGDDQFLAATALKVMDRNQIDKAVLLQGSLNGYQNYYSWQVAKEYPHRLMTSFAVDPLMDQAMTIAKRYVDQLGVRVIKFEISQGGGLHGYHRAFRLDQSPACGRLFHYLADYPGMVVTVDYGSADQDSYQPEAITHLAQTYPQLDFVVCHLSFPNCDHLDRLTNALEQWQKLPNIYTDLSAIQDIEGEQGDEQSTFLRCQKDVRLALKILGSKRLIWGTDSPWSATFNSYHHLSTWLSDGGWLTASEQEDIMANNAERVYFKPANVAALAAAEDPVVR